MVRCELKAVVRGVEIACDQESCVYWRVVDHLGISGANHSGCAVEYFDLLGERGAEIASWLLSVKERVEAAPAPVCDRD